MNNSESRLHNVFFYGLYMDPEILKSKGVVPRNPRIATADGYELKIGALATLLRNENSTATGIVYSLTHIEIDILYAESGLDMYVSEALFITCESGEIIPALCKNLLNPPEEHESNPEYQSKLTQCMKKLNVPIHFA